MNHNAVINKALINIVNNDLQCFKFKNKKADLIFMLKH